MKQDEHKNNKKLNELIDDIMGDDRNVTELAQAAGISPSGLYKIKNGDYNKVKRETLEKLASPKANPLGEVTLNDLLIAAGYEPDENLLSEDGVPDDNINESTTSKEINGRMNSYYKKFISNTEIINLYKSLDKEVSKCVYSGLAERGIVFSRQEIDVMDAVRTGLDLSLNLIDVKIKKWNFEFKFSQEKNGHLGNAIYGTIGKALRLSFDSATKLSIVINNERLYRMMEQYEHALAFRGELSLILYDDDSRELVKEIYLSNFDVGDHSREIYITE